MPLSPLVSLGRPRNRGFTLIELMIALVAMSVLALLSWRGIDGLTRSHASHQARDDSVLVLQAVLAQWRADLDAAVSPDGTLSPMQWDGRTFRITRHITTQSEPALQVVAWATRDVGGQSRWWRWQSPPLASMAAWNQAWEMAGSALQQGAGPDPAATDLMPVSSWTLSYYGNGSWANTSPPPPTGGAAYGADGIRLTLELPAGHGLSGVLTQDWLRPTHSMARGG